MDDVAPVTHRPLVHIGMAKAASTFLQQIVFPQLPEFYYLGKNTPDVDLSKAGMMIVRGTSQTFRMDHVQEVFRPHLAQAAALGKRALYSEEDLSVFKFMDPETAAGRLRQVLGPYDVIMIGRDPYSWVQSQYHFRLSTFHPSTLWGIDVWLRNNLRVVGIGSDITETNFVGVMQTYERLCGGRVHFLPYELLASDAGGFSDRLAEICEVSPASLRKLVESPRDRGNSKQRITALEANFIREAHRILQGNYTGYLKALQPYLDLPGARPNAPSLEALEALARAENNDFQEWLQPMHMLRRSLMGAFAQHSRSVNDPIASDYARIICRTGRTQRAKLLAQYGVDLAKMGISYKDVG